MRVRTWLHRFNARGLPGLADRPRPGRPRRHAHVDRGTAVALALTKPRRVGLPFELWTLARLQQALWVRHALRVARGTLWQRPGAEGLRWKHQQSWLRATVEADFVAKRRPSSRPTGRRSQAAGSSASMSWGL